MKSFRERVGEKISQFSTIIMSGMRCNKTQSCGVPRRLCIVLRVGEPLKKYTPGFLFFHIFHPRRKYDESDTNVSPKWEKLMKKYFCKFLISKLLYITDVENLVRSILTHMAIATKILITGYLPVENSDNVTYIHGNSVSDIPCLQFL